MTNEFITSIKINEPAGDIAKINALGAKLRQLADYLEKDTTLPTAGYFDGVAYVIKEVDK